MANVEFKDMASSVLHDVCQNIDCQNLQVRADGRLVCGWYKSDFNVSKAIVEYKRCEFARVDGKLGTLENVNDDWKFTEQVDLD